MADGVTIAASGKGAVGIRTWSSTDSIVNIGVGASVLGGSGGSAVMFEGLTNELNNSCSVSGADGATGMTVRTVSGDTALRNNSGTLQDNLKLATGANNLAYNQGAGTILAGALLDLGCSGVLQNDGGLQAVLTLPKNC